MRRRGQLLIIRKELESTHLLGMQFLIHQQFLDLLADVPKPDLPVTASAKDFCAIVGRGQSSQFSAILVRFIDRVCKFTRLGKKGSYLAISPTTKDQLAICLEFQGITLDP
jgi:hypothetical protein